MEHDIPPGKNQKEEQKQMHLPTDEEDMHLEMSKVDDSKVFSSDDEEFDVLTHL